MSHPPSERNSAGPATHFAPAGRAEESELRADRQAILQDNVFQTLLDSMDGFLVILNCQRQILAANPAILARLNVVDPACLLGARTGEAFGCPHAVEGPDGCGTAQHCATCGAVGAILASQHGENPAVRECLMTTVHDGITDALEFRVRATPLTVGDHEFTAVIFADISAEKRRDALEQLFFHDILNTIGGLAGWSKLLTVLKGEQADIAAARIVELSDRLTREVRDQRLLLQAESGDLAVDRTTTSTAAVLSTLTTVFASHEAAAGKSLIVEPPATDFAIKTDATLLVRVLTNMVKNALEAVATGGEVRVTTSSDCATAAFHVHNPGVMPPTVATQVFTRSFSTKASKGRGLGTYSMKLFGERYLGGRVWFETSATDGTTFTIALPATPA